MAHIGQKLTLGPVGEESLLLRQAEAAQLGEETTLTAMLGEDAEDESQGQGDEATESQTSGKPAFQTGENTPEKHRHDQLDEEATDSSRPSSGWGYHWSEIRTG